MRGKQAKKRKVSPDRKYNSILVSKLVNSVMQDGKKKIAERIVYTMMGEINKKTKKNELEVLEAAISNAKPSMEVRPRRVGGANYQIPMPVTPERANTLALRWIISTARNKKGKNFGKFLMNEILQAYEEKGDAVKKRQDVEKMAAANKAFAHFRW